MAPWPAVWSAGEEGLSSLLRPPGKYPELLRLLFVPFATASPWRLRL